VHYWLPHLGTLNYLGTLELLEAVFGSTYMLAAVSAKGFGSASVISSKVSQLARVEKCGE